MSKRCNVCGTPFNHPIYVSLGKVSVTSLCEIYPGSTEVYFCNECGHLQTSEIKDIEAYYDQAYKILIDSDEEDQIYQVVDGRKIFRTEHQVTMFMKKVDLPPNARILDYGCAKSATFKKLLTTRPDVQVHLFDVSEMYIPFWRKFVEPQNWATYRPKEEWKGSFDVVTSFFALEHVSDPKAMLSTIAGLLKRRGIFYGVLPNVYTNTADFVVMDHVNHFSSASLMFLLENSGFEVMGIDDHTHYGAWVVVARRRDSKGVCALKQAEVARFKEKNAELAQYWGTIGTKVRKFEKDHTKCTRTAIYGSGFYGTFIATCLEDLSEVECFIDQNPFRQSKQLFEKPIVGPEKLDLGVEIIYVGLNPETARSNIEAIAEWHGRSYQFFYL